MSNESIGPRQTELLNLISSAFPLRSQACAMTLRQGDEVDSYNEPAPDITPTEWRDVSDAAMEQHHWGFTHLDAESWHFYLPAFLAYSVRHPSRGESLVISACINNLRPRDRVPSRFKTLTDAQRQAVAAVLEFLAFDSESQFQNDACQVLEEYESSARFTQTPEVSFLSFPNFGLGTRLCSKLCFRFKSSS